jgi:DcaP outer membrane protein
LEPKKSYSTKNRIAPTDFKGTRKSHAYGQAKNFLIGQTLSNFMNPDASTDQLDFQRPNAQVSIRNPQFRYSLVFAEKTTFSLSVEKPTSDVAFTTPDFSAQPNSPAADGTLKLRREMDRGHVQGSALFRDVAAYLQDGRHDSVFGWGFNLAGSERLFGKDTIVCQGPYGNGIESYISNTSGLGIDAAVTSLQNPELKALPVVATYGGFQHFWLSGLRSSAVYGFVQVQNTGAQPGSAFHQSNYTAGSLIWNAYGSLNLGMGFLYGWRVNKDGASGNAPRFMFGAKYNFVRTQSNA